MRDRNELLFMGVVLALVAGVPLALYSIYYFAESIRLIAAIILGLLFIVALIGLVFARFKETIVAYVFKQASSSVDDLATPLAEAAKSFGGADFEVGQKRLSDFFRGGFAYLAWLRTRQWIVATCAALLLGFAGLVGSALLKQQNDLILEQNAYFRDQIDQQAELIALQQTLSNQTIRSEAIRRIYGSEFNATPRVKAEALRSLIAVERVRIAADDNTLISTYINLHEADISGAWLENADLANTSWRDAKANQVNFSSANLTGSVFRFAELEDSLFLNSSLQNTLFSFAIAPRAKLNRSDLTDASLVNSDLSEANLSSADLTSTSFIGTNLQGAILSDLQNWENMGSVEGTNIYDVVDPPDGFVEWALQRGAIAEDGALQDLAERGARYRAEFELDTRQN